MTESVELSKYKLTIRALMKSFETTPNEERLIEKFCERNDLPTNLVNPIVAILRMGAKFEVPKMDIINSVITTTKPYLMVITSKHNFKVNVEVSGEFNEKDRDNISDAIYAALSKMSNVEYAEVNPV